MILLHVNFPTGIIDGDKAVNPPLSKLFPEANDDKVTISWTQVQGSNFFG